MRTLQAMINGQHVATLTDNSGSWQLEYSPAWVKSEEGYDLSPRLPRASETIVDGSSERPVQWFFDNLLPEEQSRQLLAGDAKIEFADAFGLLGYYGAESAGAITLLAEPDAVIESGLRPLTDMDLSRRINNLPRVALTTDAPKRMSLAGAQYKLPVVLLKNLSFFVKPDGYRLAPHYDLLCTAIYGDSPTAWLGADLVWKTDGMRTHEEVSRAAVLRMGREIGITEALAARHIDEIVHAVEAATAKVLAECESQLTAGEKRLLLRIVHGVIRDMAARLR